MTVQEYCDPRLFPLSTQPGLSPDQQVLLDSLNYAEFRKAERDYERLSDHERAVGRELAVKAAARGSVMREQQSQNAPQTTAGKPLF